MTSMANFCVYFIQAGGLRGPIKIGVASNVNRRLVELQVANYKELQILTTIPCQTMAGALSMEKYLHDMLSSKRIRGEWFKHNIKLNELRHIDR